MINSLYKHAIMAGMDQLFTRALQRRHMSLYDVWIHLQTHSLFTSLFKLTTKPSEVLYWWHFAKRPLDSPHKGPVMRKAFRYNNVSCCHEQRLTSFFQRFPGMAQRYCLAHRKWENVTTHCPAWYFQPKFNAVQIYRLLRYRLIFWLHL